MIVSWQIREKNENRNGDTQAKGLILSMRKKVTYGWGEMEELTNMNWTPLSSHLYVIPYLSLGKHKEEANVTHVLGSIFLLLK